MAATRLAPSAALAFGKQKHFEIILEVPKTFGQPAEKVSHSDNNGTDRSKSPVERSTQIQKSFKLHVGGVLSIPSANATARPKYDSQTHHKHNSAEHSARNNELRDPFEGLPFRWLAERLGESVLPAIQAAREEQLRAEREGRVEGSKVVQHHETPYIPHILPFTRWAAQNESFRSTFVVDDPKLRKKARLSWYHPDDTMVPRDWFQGGLLADIKYYMPFGIGGDKK